MAAARRSTAAWNKALPTKRVQAALQELRLGDLSPSDYPRLARVLAQAGVPPELARLRDPRRLAAKLDSGLSLYAHELDLAKNVEVRRLDDASVVSPMLWTSVRLDLRRKHEKAARRKAAAARVLEKRLAEIRRAWGDPRTYIDPSPKALIAPAPILPALAGGNWDDLYLRQPRIRRTTALPISRRGKRDTAAAVDLIRLKIANKAEERRQIQTLRKGLKPGKAPGFAILETGDWFPARLHNKIFENLPKDPMIIFMPGRGWKRASKLPRDLFDGLVRFSLAVTNRLNKALGSGERLQLAQIQLRVTSRRAKRDLDGWHLDGGHFTVTTALAGYGTLYSPESGLGKHAVPQKILQARRGQTLIFSGSERAEAVPGVQPIHHSAPARKSKRALLVFRFDPLPDF